MKTIKINPKLTLGERTDRLFVLGVMKAHGVEYQEEKTDGEETLDGKPLDGLTRGEIIN